MIFYNATTKLVTILFHSCRFDVPPKGKLSVSDDNAEFISLAERVLEPFIEYTPPVKTVDNDEDSGVKDEPLKPVTQISYTWTRKKLEEEAEKRGIKIPPDFSRHDIYRLIKEKSTTDVI